jgi:hypothetical protein
MSTFYIENATCIHCLKELGTHNISIRVNLEDPSGTGLTIGTDSIHFRPNLHVEICPRNKGGKHVPNTIVAIPQSFLDTVKPD